MKRSTIQFKAVSGCSFLLMTLWLSGCALIGGGGQEVETPGLPVIFGNQVALAGNGTLMCTQECSERGFCGIDVSGAKVMILNSFGPATINQDLIMPDNTPVSIFGVEKREAVVKISQERIAIDYYLVNAPGLGGGWVSGWCIGQQPGQ